VATNPAHARRLARHGYPWPVLRIAAVNRTPGIDGLRTVDSRDGLAVRAQRHAPTRMAVRSTPCAYALDELGNAEAIDLFVREEDAERALDDALTYEAGKLRACRTLACSDDA
jgi:hypothetical protein